MDVIYWNQDCNKILKKKKKTNAMIAVIQVKPVSDAFVWFGLNISAPLSLFCACECLCVFMQITFWMLSAASLSVSPAVCALILQCVSNGRSRCSALLSSAPWDSSSMCACTYSSHQGFRSSE